jgi:hypothetical protein
MLSSVDLFLETIPMLFVKVTKQHLSSLWDQKGIPLSCVVLFLLILVETTHTSSLLHPLCKGEALEIFSVERQLISSQNGDWISPISVIQVFTNQVDNSSRMRKRMNNLTKWTSIQMHDLLLTEWTLNHWLTDGTERTCSMTKVVQFYRFAWTHFGSICPKKILTRIKIKSASNHLIIALIVPRSPRVCFSSMCDQVEPWLVLDTMDWLRRQHLQIPPLVIFFKSLSFFLDLDSLANTS